MNLSNYFWYFKSALTPRFCDEVIKYALEKKETMALTGGFGRGRNLHKKPLTNNQFIMFPSTQMYYITNTQKDSLNFILTITHEFI